MLKEIFFLKPILISAKKKESYRSLLEEHKDLPLDATFKDIKKKIDDDPRYTNFSCSQTRNVRKSSTTGYVSCLILNCNMILNICFRFEIEFRRPGTSTSNCWWRQN